MRAELPDSAGEGVKRFSLDQRSEIYGDKLDRVVSWSSAADVLALAGQAVRLRFVLKRIGHLRYQTGEP